MNSIKSVGGDIYLIRLRLTIIMSDNERNNNIRMDVWGDSSENF